MLIPVFPTLSYFIDVAMRLTAGSLSRRQCIQLVAIPTRSISLPTRPLSSSVLYKSIHSEFAIVSPRPIPRFYPSNRFPLSKSTYPIIWAFRSFSTPAKREKHENIYTLPNILTFTRLLSTPAIAYFILTDKPYLATGLLLYAGLTDLIDGYIARKYNLKSVVGTILDPMADKFLMITLTGALAYTGSMPRSSSASV